MKIAFISYEFPPETGFGGIGTYTLQAALAMSADGHWVEVFSCTRGSSIFNVVLTEGVLLHRVSAQNRVEFRLAVTDIFGVRHAATGFDLVESPEYYAEGIEVKKAFPGIPMVVKLHTPAYLVRKYNNTYKTVSLKKRIKRIFGRNDYRKERDIEYRFTRMADAVCSPSEALADIIRKDWGIEDIAVVPNVFFPSPSLLSLPLPSPGSQVIAFIGRLDTRKGIVALTKAIPCVLRKFPGARFRFIGGDGVAPDGKGSMRAYMLQKLGAFAGSLEFTGHVPNEALAGYLSDCALVVMPSIWENYPYACLEVMSSGRAIIASDQGGMKEIMGNCEGGLLINPTRPEAISGACIHLLNNAEMTIHYGRNNRKYIHMLSANVTDVMKDFYELLLKTAKKNLHRSAF